MQNNEYKRICWASRRGMLELDLILVPFVESVFPGLDADDQRRYIALLECEDTDMFSWFLGKENPDDKEIAHIVEKIRQHARAS